MKKNICITVAVVLILLFSAASAQPSAGSSFYSLEEVKPGYAYRLEVEDISEKAGEYTGHLYVRTDYPRKPEFVIIVNGYIREK